MNSLNHEMQGNYSISLTVNAQCRRRSFCGSYGILSARINNNSNNKNEQQGYLPPRPNFMKISSFPFERISPPGAFAVISPENMQLVSFMIYKINAIAAIHVST